MTREASPDSPFLNLLRGFLRGPRVGLEFPRRRPLVLSQTLDKNEKKIAFKKNFMNLTFLFVTGPGPPPALQDYGLPVVLKIDVENARINRLNLRLNAVHLQGQRIHEPLPVGTQRALEGPAVPTPRRGPNSLARPSSAPRPLEVAVHNRRTGKTHLGLEAEEPRPNLLSLSVDDCAHNGVPSEVLQDPLSLGRRH